MRNKEQKGDLSVQAIAGTHVVLLGMDFPEQDCAGLLGFALRREDHTEGEKYWLSGYKTFKSVEPFPPPGILYSTRQHPIQGFTWSDFSAKPEHDYTYEVFALRGAPANPQESERAAVKIRTESEHGRTHHVHFNRGAAASQEYTRLFGDKRPVDVGPAAFTWLSRGAAESIADFVGRAGGPGWGLRVGAYEFTDEDVLKALGAARDRGADVEILYHAKNDEQKIANEVAIQKFGLEDICHPRNAQGLTLSHNKTIVLTKAGAAQAVLTGSTNFSIGGIYGHSNVVHVCEKDEVAAKYLWLWNELRKMKENKFAIGSRLGKGAFNHWLVEQLSGLNVNVRYLHTKYMLVDPLGANPLVVCGSANFSEASTTNNDENMLIIRGNPRVADIYLGEFMRLYRHFAFRDWLTQHPEADEVQVGHLDETDQWWKRYFGDSFESRQRNYFVN